MLVLVFFSLVIVVFIVAVSFFVACVLVWVFVVLAVCSCYGSFVIFVVVADIIMFILK